jgi:hypothetical protein
MSDYDPNRVDPNRMDPNRMDPRRPAVNEAGYAADRGFSWNWIIGGIAALAVLIAALAFMGRDDRTADTGQSPAATTGQSSTPPASTAPASPNARPSAPATQTPPARPATPNQ